MNEHTEKVDFTSLVKALNLKNQELAKSIEDITTLLDTIVDYDFEPQDEIEEIEDKKERLEEILDILDGAEKELIQKKIDTLNNEIEELSARTDTKEAMDDVLEDMKNTVSVITDYEI